MNYARAAALLFVISFSLVGCRTIKKSLSNTENKSLTDSSISREHISIDTFRVKRDVAGLQLPAKEIQNQTFREKSNGRAKVVVRVEKDTMYVDAICDSLEHIILQRNKEVLHYRQLLNEKQIKEVVVKTQLPFLLWVLIIISVIGVVCIAGAYFHSRFKLF